MTDNPAVTAWLQPWLNQMKPINETFRQKVPYEKIVNPTVINEFAEEQVNPDAYQQASRGFSNNLSNQYMQGSNRFGAGKQQSQDLLNTYERSRQDQLQQFRNAMAGNLGEAYRQYELGYNEDPNAGYVASFMGNYANQPASTVNNLNQQLGYSFNQNPLSNNYSPLRGEFRGW